MTKIVVVGMGGDELLTDTTRYTNMQNSVGDKDFIVLEKDFREWAPAFNRRYGVFLGRQGGLFRNRTQQPRITMTWRRMPSSFLRRMPAGWLAEPGIAYRENPPFAPGGSLFSKIVSDTGFGIDAQFAAYQVQKLANSYGFGRGAQQLSRGQTRYLFIMVLIDLIEDYLLHLGKSRSHTNMTKAIIRLSEASYSGNSAKPLLWS